MVENPFVFGTVVSEEQFADRKNELRELISDLQSKTNVIIFSPRRYGKTSLIFQVINELQKKGIICAYIDLFSASNKERFAEIFATAIAQAKADKLEEILKTIKELIPPIRLTISADSTPEIGSGIGIEFTKGKKDVDATLGKLYDLPEKIAIKKKKKLVIVFDEFQEIANLDGDEIEKSLRSKIQHHKHVSYVFMGSQRHLIDQIFNEKGRPLYRIGKPFNLGKIPPNEFSKFIESRFKSTGIKIAQDIILQILKITDSHPYYTQQLCHELWNLCQYEDQKMVKEEFLISAVTQVMNNQNYAYTTMWAPLTKSQRSLLIGLAISNDSKIYSSEFRTKYGLGAASSVERAAKSLEEQGILEKERDDYVISDIFFKNWVTKIA
ncbi:MAG TPA: ATP-binding protein [Nitrosopumilaceae archaeon]|nr:ATP-binding protein [Nitrosopumilaceae archaeon]